jgi:hypothetical protein
LIEYGAMRRLLACTLLAGCDLYFHHAHPPSPAGDAAATTTTDRLDLPCIHTLAAGRLLPDGPESIFVTHACQGGAIVVNAGYGAGGLAQIDARADWGYRFTRTIVTDFDGITPFDIAALSDPGGPPLWAFRRAEWSGPDGQSVGFPHPLLDLVSTDIDGDGTRDLVVTGGDAIHVVLGTDQLPLTVTAAAETTIASGKPYAYIAVAPLGGASGRDVFYLAGGATGPLELGAMVQTSAHPLAFATTAQAEPAGPLHPLVVADVDGDGIPDVIGATSRVFVRGSKTGAITFLDEPALAIAAGDIDGDGVADAVFVTGDGSAIRRVRIAADGTLSSAPLVTSGGTATALALADVDGDGKADVVLVVDGEQPGSAIVVHRASAL